MNDEGALVLADTDLVIEGTKQWMWEHELAEFHKKGQTPEDRIEALERRVAEIEALLQRQRGEL